MSPRFCFRCFLLIQAYLEGAKLPISDYVNDTKGVVENIPRLLAAMRFIALGDKSTAGSMDLICQFARTKQYLTTTTLPSDDPLVQLPGVSNDTAARLIKNKGANIGSIRDLRALDRDGASTVFQRVRSKKAVQEKALDHLFSLPQFSITFANAYHEVDKKSGESRGRLKLSLEFEREEPARRKHSRGRIGNDGGDDFAFTLVILVGTFAQRMVLTDASLSVPRGNGTWTVSKELDFDWKTAISDGGEDRQIVLRFLWEEIRGLDAEMYIGLY